MSTSISDGILRRRCPTLDEIRKKRCAGSDYTFAQSHELGDSSRVELVQADIAYSPRQRWLGGAPLFTEGCEVKEGDCLYQIDPVPFRTEGLSKARVFEVRPNHAQTPLASSVKSPSCRNNAHLNHIHNVTPGAEGCEDCLKIGESWVQASALYAKFRSKKCKHFMNLTLRNGIRSSESVDRGGLRYGWLCARDWDDSSMSRRGRLCSGRCSDLSGFARA
jgi:hypothetical protein